MLFSKGWWFWLLQWPHWWSAIKKLSTSKCLKICPLERGWRILLTVSIRYSYSLNSECFSDSLTLSFFASSTTLFYIIIISHVCPLNTWNVATETEKLNFQFNLIPLNLQIEHQISHEYFNINDKMVIFWMYWFK